MTDSGRYSVPLDELVASAQVPPEEQVEVSDVSVDPEHDEAAGHLPGNVRPYGA